MHLCHDVRTVWVPDMVFWGSFRCSWEDGSVGVALSVDKVSSSRWLLGRCWSPFCWLACIAASFSMRMSVCPVGVVCFF